MAKRESGVWDEVKTDFIDDTILATKEGEEGGERGNEKSRGLTRDRRYTCIRVQKLGTKGMLTRRLLNTAQAIYKKNKASFEAKLLALLAKKMVMVESGWLSYWW